MTTIVDNGQSVSRIALATAQPSRGKTVRVLHLINGEHYAGAERVQDLLANRLADHGIDCAFACVKPGRFAGMRSSTVPLYNLPMCRRWDLRPAWKLARLLREDDYQLLHTHTPRTALVGCLAARLAGVPMVHHFHGQTNSEMTRRLFGRMSAVAERWSVRNASRIIAVSESVRRHWIGQGIHAGQIVVVPNGVPAPQSVVQRSGPKEIWTIGTVALFRPRKGMEVLLQALAALRDAQRTVRLRVIGRFETPEYEAEIRELAVRLGIEESIDWAGFASDVYGQLARCDVLVLPSVLAEGLPMVVLEGMACGVPVVATQVDGTIDVLRHEVNGLLATPGDSKSLAGELERLITGEIDWQVLRDRARSDYEKYYSDHSMASGIAEVYWQILDAAKTAGTRHGDSEEGER